MKKIYSKILTPAWFYAGTEPAMVRSLDIAYRRGVAINPSWTLSLQEYRQERIANSVKWFIYYVIAMMGENPYKIIGYLSHGAGTYVLPMQKKRVLTKFAKLAFGIVI